MAAPWLQTLPANWPAIPERILHRSRPRAPKLRRARAGWPALPQETSREWCPWREKLSSAPRSPPGQAATWLPDACENRAACTPSPPSPEDAPWRALWRGRRAHVWRQESGPEWSWRRYIQVYGFGRKNRKGKAATAREKPCIPAPFGDQEDSGPNAFRGGLILTQTEGRLQLSARPAAFFNDDAAILSRGPYLRVGSAHAE